MNKLILSSLFFLSLNPLTAADPGPFDPPSMTTSEIFTSSPQTTLDVESKGKGADKGSGADKKKEPQKVNLPPPVKLPQPKPQTAHYFHPGILVLQNNSWEGSDHLLNLTNQISVYVTIIKPADLELQVDEKQIQDQVEATFKAAGIKPQTIAIEGMPPLPAFEVQIFIYPIEKGFVSTCSGRLLESVSLSRFRLDEGTAFQAITWEKQSLLVSPTSKFNEQLINSVEEIADSFAKRFQAYQKLKPSV